MFSPRWAYTFRIFLAATLALGSAYYLQITPPYSAATTVFLVAHPMQGITLSKGFWRVIGTIFGAAVSVVLMAIFAQTPPLFILGFAFWLGACSAVSTLFRYFRGYAAAVAGYTIGLVVYGAIDDPSQTFVRALGRLSAVTLGVVSLSLVTALLSRRPTRKRMEDRLVKLTAEVGRFTALILESPDSISEAKRNALVDEIFGVDELLEFSSAEDFDVAVRADGVRKSMATLFAVVVCAPRIPSGASLPLVEEARRVVAVATKEAADAVEQSGRFDVGPRRIVLDARRFIAAIVIQVEALPDDLSATAMVALDRLDELLEDYATALTELAHFHHPLPKKADLRFQFHFDLRGAIDNGLRSMLSIVITGIIWFATGWTAGPTMLYMVAILCGLLGLFGNPEKCCIEFTKGIIAAVIGGFICTFWMMPYVSGFPLLIAVFAPFWIAGIVAVTYPKMAMAGTGFLLSFLTIIVPTNPMVYDVGSYLNYAVAFVLAGFVSILCFRIILPRNPANDATRFVRAIRDDVLDLFQADPKKPRLVWEHLQHHRLSRAGVLLRGNSDLAGLMSDGIAALHLGRAVLRIRKVLETEQVHNLVRRIAENGLNELRRIRIAPGAAAKAASEAARHLTQFGTFSEVASKPSHLLTAAFLDIDSLLQGHARFFSVRQPASPPPVSGALN